MADSSVPITAGSGTNIDTFTQSNGDHRQAVVVGDASAANTAGVTAGGLAVNGGSLSSTSGAIAAGATGTVGPVDVSAAGNVTFIVKNTTAASAWAGNPVLVFEQSDDGTSWGPLPVVRNDSGAFGYVHNLGGSGVANQELTFEAGVESINQVRCRVVAAPATNGLTVVIQSGGMPFAQGMTVNAVPLDGQKPTAISASNGTFVPHTTAAIGQPFLILTNAAGSGLKLRVLRIRLGLTLATAAALQIGVARNASLNTGGTSTSFAGGYLGHDSLTDGTTPSTSNQSVKAYTAAPTTNGGAAAIGFRRIWVGLSTASGVPYLAEWTFGSGKPGKAVVLNASEQVGCYWSAAPATAVAADFEVEWTEEPA